MCGISGVYRPGDADLPYADRSDTDLHDLLAEMNHALAHRGPDGATIWTGPAGIGFGHTRLAIVGVDDGAQPSFGEDGAIVVVLNGEIYNHRSLRTLLEAHGHRLNAASDTEVLPHLYEEYGSRFVEYLDGDFAIAVWDSRSATLHLARDQAGVKPLFWTVHDGTLAFASEIKALFAAGIVEPEVDPQGLADCQFFGHTVAPATFFRGVHELPPASLMTVSPDLTCETRSYYRVFAEATGTDEARRGRDGLSDYQNSFEAAVNKRIPDEVGWGVALSGGLDSSTICGTASKTFGSKPLTLSIDIRGSDLNETSESRRVARSLDLPNVEIPMDGPSAAALVEEAMYHFESPFWYGIVAAPFLDLAQRAAQEDLKVLMSGDGSDEILGGYDFYRLVRIRNALERFGLTALEPLAWRLLLPLFGAPDGFDAHILAVHRRKASYDNEFGAMPAWIYMWSALSGRMASIAVARPLPHSTLPVPSATVDMHRHLSHEFHTRLPGWVLAISDRLGMARGIEVRVPFLDRILLSTVATLHPSLMLRGMTEKYALKRAATGVLPAETVKRRKKPFMTPIAPWYLGSAESGPSALAEKYLGPQMTDAIGIYEPSALVRLLDEAMVDDGSWACVTAEWACLSVMATHIVIDQFIHQRSFERTGDLRPSAVVATPMPGGAR